jgi:dephospho-CoA kinase
MILLHPLERLAGIVTATLLARWAAAEWGAQGLPVTLTWVGVGLLAAVLLWSCFDWAARTYTLTSGAVIRESGVIRRVRVEMPLRNVQNITIVRSLRERVFGLGTPVFASAAGGAGQFSWYMITSPGAVVETVKRAIDQAGGGAPGGPPWAATPAPLAPPAPPERPLVIGLVGGIGSGKSRVAKILAELGCAVSDSDAVNRQVLRRPDVRSALVSWWGDSILGPDGEIDRRRIAERVFSSEDDRRRLESLTHPLIRAEREALFARVAEELARSGAGTSPRAERPDEKPGRGVVVVDAPLLLEAGLDRECDAVVFVDAPVEVRAARVRASRGWDAGELERRERAQWPVDEKRRRAGHVVVNDSDDPGAEERLRARLRALLTEVRLGAGGPPKRASWQA